MKLFMSLFKACLLVITVMLQSFGAGGNHFIRKLEGMQDLSALASPMVMVAKSNKDGSGQPAWEPIVT